MAHFPEVALWQKPYCVFFGEFFELNYLLHFLGSFLTALTCSQNIVNVESAPTVSVSFS